ncbi:MAG: YigZ family protein [Bacteroidales bacterium]|nr:YigZ family protein [Bacteroidales bacterium]
MFSDDTYKTIKKKSEGIFKDRGSKFLSFAYPVSSADETKSIINDIRKKHHSAKHKCYAYVLGNKKTIQKANDDGEPSNTAGKPILNQIISNSLTNVMIVVVRYFGGSLLGINGLTKAYRNAAADSIKNAEIITNTINESFKATAKYVVLNDIIKILIENKVKYEICYSEANCEIKFSIRKKLSESIVFSIKKFVDNIESLESK